MPSGPQTLTQNDVLTMVARLQQSARCDCGWVYGRRVANDLGASGKDVGARTGWRYWTIAEQLERQGDLVICRAKDPRPCPNMKSNTNYVRLADRR